MVQGYMEGKSNDNDVNITPHAHRCSSVTSDALPHVCCAISLHL